MKNIFFCSEDTARRSRWHYLFSWHHMVSMATIRMVFMVTFDIKFQVFLAYPNLEILPADLLNRL